MWFLCTCRVVVVRLPPFDLEYYKHQICQVFNDWRTVKHVIWTSNYFWHILWCFILWCIHMHEHNNFYVMVHKIQSCLSLMVVIWYLWHDCPLWVCKLTYHNINLYKLWYTLTWVYTYTYICTINVGNKLQNVFA